MRMPGRPVRKLAYGPPGRLRLLDVPQDMDERIPDMYQLLVALLSSFGGNVIDIVNWED